MLGAMLGEALGCVVTPESHFKHHLMRRCEEGPLSRSELARFFSESNELAFWGLTFDESEFPQTIDQRNLPEVINHVIWRYHSKEREKGAGGCNASLRWVDHTPVNVESFSQLLSLYPMAKFVHIVRDPRGVAASVLPLAWGPNDPIRFVEWWQRHVAAGLTLQNNWPDQVMEVRYEELVANPEPTLRKLCEFLGLTFCESLVRGQQFEPAEHSKAQHALVGQAPVKGRVDAWKKSLSSRDILFIEAGCFAMMRQLGYGPFLLKSGIKASALGQPAWHLKIVWNRFKGSIRRKLLRRSRRRLAQKLRAGQR